MSNTSFINTSADDLLSSLRCSIERISVKDFEDAIEKEKMNRNRTTVIKLLKRAIRYKKQGARHL